MSVVKLGCCVLLKGRSLESTDHCRGPKTLRQKGRKGVLMKKSACVEFDSIGCSFLLHVAVRALLLHGEHAAGVKKMV